ncbi:MAG: AAA family ATPase [Nodosilinea sp.]
MQILSVALQNFKTHQDRYFEFQPGTNAICGENGAGKTSILEAIAWVLFNYQGEYAKEDLIRNGSGSAQVTVAFTSNYDGRTYEVQRCTQRGYVLFDPQLNERLPYNRIKDEILPWLRQHIGVGPTTNLPQLFARTLGVPQGTFTADFLQPAEHRKSVFDAILKVEDYKVAFKQMNSLRRYAEDQVDALKGQISQYEEALTAWDELHQRRQALRQEVQTDEQQLEQRHQTLQTLQAQRDSVKAQAQHIQALAGQRQGLTHQLEAKQQSLGRLQQSVEQAAQAIALCQANRSAFEAYQAVEQALQSLAQQQQQRQALQEEYQARQKNHGQKQAELARWQAQLDAFAATARDLEQLQPQIVAQEQLETQQQEWQTQLDQLQRLVVQQQGWQEQLRKIGQQQDQATQTQARLMELQGAVAEILALEEQRDRAQQQLSRLAAARQFEGEIKALVTTSQSQRQMQDTEIQAALKHLEQLGNTAPLLTGETLGQIQRLLRGATALHGSLLDELEAILRDLADQTDEATLKTTLKTLDQTLKQRYGWRGELEQLPALEAQRQQLQQEHTTLAGQIAAVNEQLAHQPTVVAALADLKQQLETLGRPREKSQILTRTLQDRGRVEQAYATLVAAQTEQGQQLAELAEKLEEFKGLDQAVAEQQRDRAQHQAGHGLYLQHRQLANHHSQLQAELEQAQHDLKQIQEQFATVEQAYTEAMATFDPAQAEALEASYSRVKSEADQLAGSLPQQRQRLGDFDQQIAGLEVTAQRRDQAQQRLQAKERIKRFINFARKAYNEAGPRITEQYVRSISQQADRLFRELLNRPNVALQWTRDYEIVVQDGPHLRRFVNLSGGEQMCAALAVRLALLKVLADVDIAFFDEPTTNMDRTRREGLAEAISRIKTFQQLFVISHDDTFEKITENVIVVERDVN